MPVRNATPRKKGRTITQRWFPGRPGDPGWYIQSTGKLYGPMATDRAANLLAVMMAPGTSTWFRKAGRKVDPDTHLAPNVDEYDDATELLILRRDRGVEILSPDKLPWRDALGGEAWPDLNKITVPGLAHMLERHETNFAQYKAAGYPPPKAPRGRPKIRSKKAEEQKIPARFMRL